MGVKLGGGLLRCGTCGKRYSNPFAHACVTRATSRRRVTRTKLQPRLTVTCATCGKVRGVGHTCAPKSDFKARKRKQATAERRGKQKAATAKRAARRKQAAADRRARGRARKQAAGKKPRPSRPRGDSHEPGTCGDKDCPRFGCKSYWQGMADCPGPHCEGGHG